MLPATKRDLRKISKRPILILTVLGLCALIAMSCETLPSDPAVFDTADLLGVVYDGSSKPVQGFVILIDGKATSTSDLNGHFTFINVKRGTHQIVAKKTGFEAFETQFDFMQKSQILYLTINSLQDYLQNADLALSKKDFAVTVANLDRAANIDPKNPIVLYMRALVGATVGNYDDAMTNLDTLIGLGVKDEPVYLLRLDIAIAKPEFSARVIQEIESQSLLKLNPRIAKKLAVLMNKKE